MTNEQNEVIVEFDEVWQRRIREVQEKCYLHTLIEQPACLLTKLRRKVNENQHV